MKTHGLMSLFAVLLAGEAAAQHTGDIQVQAQDGRVVLGSASLDAGNNTLGVNIGERVYSGMLMSNYRGSDPGFNTDPTGSLILPQGVEGFAGGSDVSFDLLPIHLGATVANFLYWDGLGDGETPTTDDVDFALAPSNVSWTLVDDDFNFITADGSDQLVPGGVVDTTRSSGSFHNHLIVIADDGDGNINTTPDAGIYMASLQLSVDGFEPSEPIFVISRSFQFDPVAVDVAAEWINANYDALIGLDETLPGDINGDGSVDLLDLDILGANFGANPATLAEGDLNGDSSVDLLDLDILGANFGATAATAAVPEPAALALVMVGWSVAALRRSRVRAG